MSTTTEPKVKKEKSSKKRKAVALAEPSAKSASEVDAPIVPSADVDSSAAAPIKKQRKSKSTPSSSEPDKMDPPSNATSHEDSSSPEPATKKRKAPVDEIEVDITAPEPPSKKALRALKKGKPLPPSKSGAESSPEPEAAAKKKEVEKRSEHGVWIGNMPFTVSKEDLRKFLTEQSDLTDEMITRIHMPGPNDGKSANQVEEKKFGRKIQNKGFAYVDFTTAEGVGYAIELSEQLLSGRAVLIKNNKSFEGRPEKTKAETRMEGKPPSKRVFIGNLRFDATEKSIKDHFEKCGAVESVKVATFEDSGKCKGYAWIVFEELEAAEAAVRGFVRIDEPVESEDEESSADEEAADGETAAKAKPVKTKTRKWWVNKIAGRPLRMEFAEEAAVRYKKRYGKDGTKRVDANGQPLEGAKVFEEKKIVPNKHVEYRTSYAPRLTGGIVEAKGTKTKL